MKKIKQKKYRRCKGHFHMNICFLKRRKDGQALDPYEAVSIAISLAHIKWSRHSKSVHAPRQLYHLNPAHTRIDDRISHVMP
jgi:hypothetical protein